MCRMSSVPSPPDIRHIAMPVGQREGGGPLPSIESDIQPLKTVKSAVVGQFGKRGILPAPDAVQQEHELAGPVCRY